MTDRPIIFSAPMVRALLAGAKTQTRRLATSPLRRSEVGDRLWVREAFEIVPASAYRCSDGVHQTIDPSDRDNAAIYAAGWERSIPKWKPSIHMPRWASRLTLVVEAVRVEPLQSITESDSRAEGLCLRLWEVEEGDDCETVEGWSTDRFLAFRSGVGETARDGYEVLWNHLHGARGQRWADNPAVVVVTFRILVANIDKLPK